MALDDFGEGFSSIPRLQDMPVEVVKIDRGFVGGLVPPYALAAKRREVTRATIELLHALGKTVVAEGVEDRMTADVLADAGCDLAQGYLFSEPLAPPDLERFWRSVPRLHS